MTEPAESAPRRSALGTIFLTVFIDLVGFSIIFPLFPDMLDHYLGREGAESFIGRIIATLSEWAGGATEAESAFRTQVLFGGLLGSLYSALQFLCAPFWGRLSDRHGRRPVLLVTISGLALSYLAWFFAGHFWILVASRLFGGAMSGNLSVASAAIADSTDERNRTKGMALIGIAVGVGFIIGPAIGALASRIDIAGKIGGESIGVNPFSAPAGIAFLLAAANLIQVARRFPETLSPETRGRSTTRRTANPLRLFARRDLPGVDRTNLAYFVYVLVFAGMEFTLTFLAKDRFGYDAWRLGGVFLYIGAILVLVQGGLVRRLAPRIGEKKLALVGFVLLGTGLAVTGASVESSAGFYIGLAFLATGSALATPSLTGLVSLYTPPQEQGEIQGVFRSLGALGRAVGPLIACTLYWQVGPLALYLSSAGLFAIPLVLCASLPPARGEREKTTAS